MILNDEVRTVLENEGFSIEDKQNEEGIGFSVARKDNMILQVYQMLEFEPHRIEDIIAKATGVNSNE